MVGRALVRMVPSRADASPVTMRDTMMAQERHFRMVALVLVANGISEAWCVVSLVLFGDLPKMAGCEIFCCNTGSKSCVAMISQSSFECELTV